MSDQTFRFLLIEKDLFVARDMQEGLRMALPDCDIRCLSLPEDIHGALAETEAQNGSAPRVVIVTKLSVDQIDLLGLTDAASRHRAEMVVRRGDDPPEAVAARGWFSLASPFTWDDLSDLAGDLRGRRSAA
ncbi:hypothetical protein [Paracoccus spongiarum]|uniref:Response regulatory domain-containing protein n=1 Tax=Paracoccus spongiarum TaxID=3064387 RepID=A0ABT9JE12_9RHOB|nr:hypothetical protein [Paracoccus sp. 2205BS29-5]MDP5308067.1 hypothetical protein [Paracoccus sp. 2205BS29-5]